MSIAMVDRAARRAGTTGALVSRMYASFVANANREFSAISFEQQWREFVDATQTTDADLIRVLAQIDEFLRRHSFGDFEEPVAYKDYPVAEPAYADNPYRSPAASSVASAGLAAAMAIFGILSRKSQPTLEDDPSLPSLQSPVSQSCDVGCASTNLQELEICVSAYVSLQEAADKPAHNRVRTQLALAASKYFDSLKDERDFLISQTPTDTGSNSKVLHVIRSRRDRAEAILENALKQVGNGNSPVKEKVLLRLQQELERVHTQLIRSIIRAFRAMCRFL
jgi:hypothetical protein